MPGFPGLPLALDAVTGQDHAVVITDVVVAECNRHIVPPEVHRPPLGGHVQIPISTESEDQSWQDYANCLGVDPDLFFPERGASTREAKEVCRGCVVREDCLEYALVNGEKFGIWGGMSERERRRLRRQRALARRVSTA
jgi:WhiB family transcriptional regulator, redox-sensing transcriptional regulator